MTTDTSLNCPVCKNIVLWNDAFPHRPFCSKRCQQIDFGDWATEAHVIAEKLPAGPDFDEFSLDDMGIDPEGNGL